MKAIVQTRYGPPEALELREVDRPAVGDDEVLVRVRASSVHPDVWHVLRGRPYALRLMGAGFRAPRISVPGTDLAGVVESTGPAATRFQPGDEVFGECVRGHQWKNGGAYAEYAAVRETALASKPANVTFEQAAAVPTSGLIALAGVRGQGHVRAGQRVLVNGAGGGVGTIAVQLAKAAGAHVTAVDSASKLDVLDALGADEVLDYAREDFTRTGVRYDVIVDIPGNRSLSDYRRALTPEGVYVLIGHDGFGSTGGRWIGSIGRFLGLALATRFVSQNLSPRTERIDAPLDVLAALLESGELTPVIDRTYALAEAAQAIRRLEQGEGCGKIVLSVPAAG